MNEDYWEKPTEQLKQILEVEQNRVEMSDRGSFDLDNYKYFAALDRIRLIQIILESRREEAAEV